MTQSDDDFTRREQRALRRLRTSTPRCATCGEDRWQCLELHHVAGQAHDDTVAIECGNCHRILSDAQRDHPAERETDDPYLAMIGRFLLGLADMLQLVVEKLVEFGRDLIDLACVQSPAQGIAQ